MSQNDERARVEECIDSLLDSFPPDRTPESVFWEAQFDHGLAWVRFPGGCGGLGVSSRWQGEVDARIRKAGGSTANRDANVVGIGMAAPTLVEHASSDLARRLLRRLFTTEEIWCQLFSEPGAGSDLAGVSTSAVRDGEDWLVTGQKVWTTLAHKAKWGLLLARTDPDVPKHAGLTFFVVDMSSPGVEVRPLFQMTGEAEFNEVYLDAVRVPDSMRLGEVGQGWRVALTTLMNERVVATGGAAPRGAGPISTAMELWKASRSHDPVRRDELMRHWVAAEVLRLTELRASENAGNGTPGPEGSVAKLSWAEVNKAITSFTVDLMGTAGTLYPDGYEFVRPESSQVNTDSPHKAFLRARANSIEGGTSEIMKNILAERVLGLPGEPRDDRTIPWREVPRS